VSNTHFFKRNFTDINKPYVKFMLRDSCSNRSKHRPS